MPDLSNRLAVQSLLSLAPWGLALALVFMAAMVVIYQRRLASILERSLLIDGMQKVLASLPNTQATFKALLHFLENQVQSENYAVYLRDSRSSSFQLKAVRRYGSDELQIEVCYGRLSEYKKESYRPPLTMELPHPNSEITEFKYGDVPLLFIPLGQEIGFIIVGPLRTLKATFSKRIELAFRTLRPALALMVQAERTQQQLTETEATIQSARAFTQTTMGPAGAVVAMMQLTVSLTSATGGCIIHDHHGRTELLCQTGLDKLQAARLASEPASQRALIDLSGDGSLTVINNKSQAYWHLPPSLATIGGASLMLQRIDVPDGGQVVGLVWYEQTVEIDQHHRSAFGLLMSRMGEMVSYQNALRSASSTYMDAMKLLVNSVDNLTPYTVGHSNLIAHFAGVIAKAKGLSEQECLEISLAAYLHDLGMISLSGEQLFKSGKYTETEYATMKLHAEIGGSIIETTTGSSNVAAYVRHHHERWDGNGYPYGLRQDMIPLGARIIAVADMFVAKLSARKNRPPLPFAQALIELNNVAGSQLDPTLVGIFTDWYHTKLTDTRFQGRSLGPCWGMRCCPPSVRLTCPAGTQTAKNCWEVEGVQCAAHGNECSSCFVYSEYAHRSGIKDHHETASNS